MGFANLKKCTEVEEKYNTSFTFFRTNSCHLKAKNDVQIASDCHKSSANFKKFPGLRPWTPLGGLTAPPPNPPAATTRSLRALRALRSSFTPNTFFPGSAPDACHVWLENYNSQHSSLQEDDGNLLRVRRKKNILSDTGTKEGRKEGRKEGWKEGRKSRSK